ncbi:uncharacterized protein Triagg1_8611 [Trichoderma aggressivum f. europaeum]|uniref:Dihydroorotate dehydrogenase catalytic domain-containing protein n=1 Tax=Trichoderma aggressivum f. europaeum TaxID=173218 RepID=A0AAE1LW10_9HYPO|nr:hypothetical protein Triagg1_8611 [Trichoderma aggressivum f. europaeum]
MPPKLSLHPPLLNTASPWATSRAHLAALLRCPSVGAVTTRTSLVAGFPHAPDTHRYALFDPATGAASATFSGPPEDSNDNEAGRPDLRADKMPLASLNTLGYSPLPLSEYLSIISSLASSTPPKTIIISVTGSPAEILTCHTLISSHAPSVPFPLAMEINLSCPNIPNLPPPAYSPSSLSSYLDILPSESAIPIGIKIPPYTHAGQFDDLVSCLISSEPNHPPASKLSFLTATNTLGSCLLLDPDSSSDDALLPGGGIGGMAGPPLHPLALGNVATLRRRFDADPRLAHLDIIGAGGVYDGQGYKRMRRVGAVAVGIATALGRQGVGVFASIETDIHSTW